MKEIKLNNIEWSFILTPEDCMERMVTTKEVEVEDQ